MHTAGIVHHPMNDNKAIQIQNSKFKRLYFHSRGWRITESDEFATLEYWWWSRHFLPAYKIKGQEGEILNYTYEKTINLQYRYMLMHVTCGEW